MNREKVDDKENPIKNLILNEMIEMAKNSEYGGVWYSEKGPIQITKDGQLIPLTSKKCLDKDINE